MYEVKRAHFGEYIPLIKTLTLCTKFECSFSESNGWDGDLSPPPSSTHKHKFYPWLPNY